MKFLDKYELNLFFIESGNCQKINSEEVEFEPDSEMLEGVFIKRQDRKASLPSFRKSQDTEGQWRGMRYKMLSGIRRFHRSTEGKRQHRAMARFLANREIRPSLKDQSILSMQERSLLITDLDNFVQDLSDFHEKYFHPIDDYFDLFVIRKSIVNMCEEIISNLISPLPLNEDQNDFIEYLVEENSLVFAISEGLDMDYETVMDTWNCHKRDTSITLSKNSLLTYQLLAAKVIEQLKK
jgi:hypothetical protein